MTDMNKTEQEPRSELSDLTVKLGHFPPERLHIKTETWWLAERSSPAIYLGNEGNLTTSAWAAKKFSSLELAQEFISSSLNVFGTDWRILDHMFYV